MSDNKRNNLEFDDYAEFNKKYGHYSDYNSSSSDQEMEFEDITSYSDGNADFYMQPRQDDNSDVEIAYGSEPETNNMMDKKNKKKSQGNFFTRNRGKNIKIIALSLVIVLLIVSGGGLAWFYFYYLSDGTYDDEGKYWYYSADFFPDKSSCFKCLY